MLLRDGTGNREPQAGAGTAVAVESDEPLKDPLVRLRGMP